MDWPDADRRDAALERIAQRIAGAGELSSRELAVVFLTSHGIERKQAARMLNVEPSTVASYAARAQLKLEARNPPHAVATALRLGLIE